MEGSWECQSIGTPPARLTPSGTAKLRFCICGTLFPLSNGEFTLWPLANGSYHWPTRSSSVATLVMQLVVLLVQYSVPHRVALVPVGPLVAHIQYCSRVVGCGYACVVDVGQRRRGGHRLTGTETGTALHQTRPGGCTCPTSCPRQRFYRSPPMTGRRWCGHRQWPTLRRWRQRGRAWRSHGCAGGADAHCWQPCLREAGSWSPRPVLSVLPWPPLRLRRCQRPRRHPPPPPFVPGT